MDKTININLGGSLFQLDEEAYNVLRDYIQAINNRFRNLPGGPETIEDIEFRIAEIFRSQKGLAGIITKENVESMISTIGKPEDFDTDNPDTEPAGESIPKRLYRNPDDSVISGVCGGLGAYLNTDPVLFRILFIIFTLFGGAGILVYLVFWIAVPSANNESKKREMYGSYYFSYRNPDATRGGTSSFSTGFNEVIRAIGKVFYIILRIFLVIFGTILVLTGFLFILTFVMIFVFKIPEAFFTEGIEFSLTYLPNMLEYIFSPASAPWIWALSIIVFMLPMIALIYWGVRMIFWFRVRDGIFNLSMFIVWVLSLTALSVMVFSEGISFAENASATSRNILQQTPDTLKIITRNRIADLEIDTEFRTPDDEYNVFIADSTRNLYIKPRLRFRVAEDDNTEIEVRKRASGRNRRIASENAESISYNYQLKEDTVFLDEYFIIPSGKKWTANFVHINFHIPENTVIHMDRGSAGLLPNRIHFEHDDDESWDSYRDADMISSRYWKITENGLREAGRKINHNN